jgi:hypothetical protein
MDAWTCPLCGHANRPASAVCASCFYGRREPPTPAAPRTGAEASGMPASPNQASSSVPSEIPSASLLAPNPRWRDGVMGLVRWTWAALASVGVLAAAIGLGWWWGAGQSRPLAEDLATAQATIQRLEAPRPATRTVGRPVPAVPTALGAGWHQSGTFSPADAITVPVVLENPLNGRTMRVSAIIDTGSYVTLVSRAVAGQLGLERVQSSLIGGVSGTGSNAIMSGVDIADPAGQVIVRLGSIQTMVNAMGPLLLGRDVLDLPGVALTTLGDRWALTLPTTGEAAEGGPDILTAHGPVAPPNVPAAPPSTTPAPVTSSAWPPPGATPPQPNSWCSSGWAVTWPTSDGGSATQCTNAQGIPVS